MCRQAPIRPGNVFILVRGVGVCQRKCEFTE